MSGPADNSPVCPKCGLFLAVRGCTLETCAEESGRRSTSPSTPPAPPLEDSVTYVEWFGKRVPPTPVIETHPLPWSVRRSAYQGRFGPEVDWVVVDANGKSVAECTDPLVAQFICDAADWHPRPAPR